MPYKGTQPNHYVTDSNNHTKTISDSGQPMSDATKKELLKEQPQITKFQFKFWPFWLKKIPSDPNKVKINILLD
jgi:hypothetical protein